MNRYLIAALIAILIAAAFGAGYGGATVAIRTERPAVGPAGPTGPVGPQGLAGAQGPAGADGKDATASGCWSYTLPNTYGTGAQVICLGAKT